MENVTEKTDAQKEVEQALENEKTECWSELTGVLNKYGYRFSNTFTVNDQRGVGFIIDIIKVQPK